MDFLKDLKPSYSNDYVQWCYFANNSYGAIIMNINGLDYYELAVITFVEGGGVSIRFDTPIGNDVLSNLTEQDVNDLLVKISEL